MAWADARARIASILSGVTITSPTSLAILAVHEFPTENITEARVFYMVPPALSPQRGAGVRVKVYTMRVQFLCRDDSVEQMNKIADAFREATLDVFDQDIALNGNAAIVGGPEFGESEQKQFSEDGPVFVGWDMTITVRLVEAATFAI